MLQHPDTHHDPTAKPPCAKAHGGRAEGPEKRAGKQGWRPGRSASAPPARALRNATVSHIIAQAICGYTVGPIRLCLAQGRSGAGIRIEPQDEKRRGARHRIVRETGVQGSTPRWPKIEPKSAIAFLPAPPAPSAQPYHGGTRHRSCIIARTRDNRNRHGAGQPPPILPTMELRQIVASHQPDKASAGVASNQRTQTFHGKTRAQLALDRGYANRGTAGHRACRSDPRRQWRHARRRLEHVTGRDQPPHLVQPERRARKQAHPAVTAVRRVEAAAQKAGQRRAVSFQGRTCPLPCTSHL